MGAYEIIKDCISVAQKADNIELIKSLIEAQSQVLALQNENMNLTNRIHELETKNDITSKIERHTEPFITLIGNKDIMYCSHCWDAEQKLIQLDCSDGEYTCPHCKYQGNYDRQLASAIQQKNLNALLGNRRYDPFSNI